MEFIKDQQINAGELRIVLQHPRQNTFGDDLQSCGFAGFLLAAHPVAHLLSDRLTELLRQIKRDIPGCQPTRFQHNDTAGTRQLLQ